MKRESSLRGARSVVLSPERRASQSSAMRREHVRDHLLEPEIGRRGIGVAVAA